MSTELCTLVPYQVSATLRSGRYAQKPESEPEISLSMSFYCRRRDIPFLPVAKMLGFGRAFLPIVAAVFAVWVTSAVLSKFRDWEARKYMSHVGSAERDFKQGTSELARKTALEKMSAALHRLRALQTKSEIEPAERSFLLLSSMKMATPPAPTPLPVAEDAEPPAPTPLPVADDSPRKLNVPPRRPCSRPALLLSAVSVCTAVVQSCTSSSWPTSLTLVKSVWTTGSPSTLVLTFQNSLSTVRDLNAPLALASVCERLSFPSSPTLCF